MEREEVIKFLNGFQWKRIDKNELEKKCQEFFGIVNTLADTSEELEEYAEEDEICDFTYAFTNERHNGNEDEYTLIDVEFYYLPCRDGKTLLITETELLTFEENYI